MNFLLTIIEIVVVFGLLLLCKKLFGKYGVIGWMGIASVIANIQILKSVDILGISATVGNVLFASNFLATDILSESYGKKAAKKGVYFALFSVLCYLVFSQILLAYNPNAIDFANDSMHTLFELAPRISVASIIMFFLSNILDVNLYEWLKKKTGGKYIWLRNNVCTMLCNSLENFFFYLIAFGGTMAVGDLMGMAIACSIIEIFIALCDTPFLYISRKLKCKSETRLENGEQLDTSAASR